MQVGENMVGFVMELGHSASWARYVDNWVRGLNALVTDLG